MTTNKEVIKRELQLELARRDFYYYCKTKYPEFYKEDRKYLKTICRTLQKFYEKRPIKGRVYTKMMINIPPRHGKTFTIKNFCEWVYGRDKKKRIFDISYNEKLSLKFARSVRDSIMTEKTDEEAIIYNDFFPDTKIKVGDASVNNWSIEGGYNSFLASSPKATMTGMGCDIGIIDDLIKSMYEAFNDTILDSHYEFYTDTYLSRLEEGALQLLVMTRWSENDLCGKVLKEDKDNWYVLSMPALIDEDKKEMLCDSLLSYESYMDKVKYMSKEIVSANYDQQPATKKGKLYTSFKYIEDESPVDKFEKIIAYVDTADMGKDMLCAIVAGIFEGRAYLLDVYVSVERMEITEGEVADLLYRNQVNMAYIESNNGGRGFARNVEKILWDKYESRYTKVKWFFQSKNKIARIKEQANFISSNILFPKNWNKRWKVFYEEIVGYKHTGKNKYDDCADCLTGIAEKTQSKGQTFMSGGG